MPLVEHELGTGWLALLRMLGSLFKIKLRGFTPKDSQKERLLKPAFEAIIVSYKPGDKRELQIDECHIPYSKDNPPIPQLVQGKTSVISKKIMFDGPLLYKSKTKAVIGGN